MHKMVVNMESVRVGLVQASDHHLHVISETIKCSMVNMKQIAYLDTNNISKSSTVTNN